MNRFAGVATMAVFFVGAGFILPGLQAIPAWAQDNAPDVERFSTQDSSANPFGPLLGRNQPVDVHGMQAVCTGVDSDTRADPRWKAFPLKLEFATNTGELLAFAQVHVADVKGKDVLDVRCPGAWLLLGLSPGEYKATVAVAGYPVQTATVAVPKTGQKSMTLQFKK